MWKNDEELFAILREELFTAVIGYIMNKMDFLHQFLPTQIQHFCDDISNAGRAMTVLEADCKAKNKIVIRNSK